MAKQDEIRLEPLHKDQMVLYLNNRCLKIYAKTGYASAIKDIKFVTYVLKELNKPFIIRDLVLLAKIKERKSK